MEDLRCTIRYSPPLERIDRFSMHFNGVFFHLTTILLYSDFAGTHYHHQVRHHCTYFKFSCKLPWLPIRGERLHMTGREKQAKRWDLNFLVKRPKLSKYPAFMESSWKTGENLFNKYGALSLHLVERHDIHLINNVSCSVDAFLVDGNYAGQSGSTDAKPTSGQLWGGLRRISSLKPRERTRSEKENLSLSRLQLPVDLTTDCRN